MSGDRYEISEGELDVLAITGPEGTRYIDGAEIEARAIRQQASDIASRDAVISACAEAVGASVSPDCSDEFRAMLPGEIRAKLAAAVAERDDYRDEFSGLCHALSVGSEGRPEMTAADWRQRVDDGIEYLLRPLIAERDTLRARLAAIDNAPTIAKYAGFGLGYIKHSGYYPPIGTELIARPAKE